MTNLLFNAMTERRTVRYAGMDHKVIAIALEDGSGKRFNIKLAGPCNTTTVVYWDSSKLCSIFIP